MRTRVEYAWDVQRTFVDKRLPKPIVRKSGKVIKKVKVPITIYRLFLTGDLVTTQAYRCVPVVRSGALSWSISALTEPAKPKWPMLELRPDPKRSPSWKRWASMTAAEFSDWLSRVLGAERARKALGEMNEVLFFSA